MLSWAPSMDQKQKLSLNIAALCSLIATGLHAYLAKQHYGLKFGGAAGDSICNISDRFNCDAVAASVYSSFAGVPLAIWGAMANLVLLFLLLVTRLEWTDEPKATGRYALWLALGVALTSVVMGVISTTLMHNLCLFCIAAYVLSFVGLGATWVGVGGLGAVGDDVAALFTSRRWVLGMFVAVPALAFLVNAMVVKNQNFGALELLAQEKVAAWTGAPAQTFDAAKGLTLGAGDDARMTIVEFADFRCPHCKHASPTLKAFTAAHPDVRLVFKFYPLDGTCNSTLGDGRGDGISCRLAALVQCEQKLRQQGWKAHDFIFDNQERFSSMGRIEEVDTFYCEGRDADCATLKTCADSAETRDEVRAQANEGGAAQIRGTPAVFVNGKSLGLGHLMPVLDEAYRRLRAN